MSYFQNLRIQNTESSGFRILKSSKKFYLQIFRIQDPESSGSKDPAGKSQEGQGEQGQHHTDCEPPGNHQHPGRAGQRCGC